MLYGWYEITIKNKCHKFEFILKINHSKYLCLRKNIINKKQRISKKILIFVGFEVKQMFSAELKALCWYQQKT